MTANVEPWAHGRPSADPRGQSLPPSPSQVVSRLLAWQRADLLLEEPGAGRRSPRQRGQGWTPTEGLVGARQGARALPSRLGVEEGAGWGDLSAPRSLELAGLRLWLAWLRPQASLS